MNIIRIYTGSKITNIAGLGPTAWNHGDQSIKLYSAHHHHEQHEAGKTRQIGLRDLPPPRDDHQSTSPHQATCSEHN